MLVFVFYFCRALPRVCGCSPLWWSGTSSSWRPHRMGVRSGPVVSQYVWLVFVSPHLPYLPLAGRTIIHSHSANPQNPAIDEASLPCGIEPSNCEGGSLIAPVTELIFFLFRINTFYTSRICCKFCHFQFRNPFKTQIQCAPSSGIYAGRVNREVCWSRQRLGHHREWGRLRRSCGCTISPRGTYQCPLSLKHYLRWTTKLLLPKQLVGDWG